MAPVKTWNWQQAEWPDFQYESSRLKALEDDFLRRSGLLLGAYLHVTEEEKLTLIVDRLSDEALKTSEIEGEILNRESVQSSIRRQLGLMTDRRSVKPAEAGIAEMMVDLTTVRSKPQQNQLCSGGWWWCFVVIGLQGA